MPLDLVTAQQQLDDARATLATLQEQVRDGDASVTPEQLADQRHLIEYAQLRVTAAQRAEQEAAAAALDARARATGDRVYDLVTTDSTAPLTDAVRAVIDAVTALVQAADKREATIREVAAEATNMNGELGAGPGNHWPTRRYGYMAQVTPPVSVSTIEEGTARAVPAGELLGVALAAALVDRADVRQQAAQTASAIPEAVAHSIAGVPGLAAALRYTPEEWQTLDERARYEASAQGRRPVAEGAPA
ncbi:hypothetical protein ACH4FA_06355 [Streptomyces sp. NPDC017966]|uniref:hypothetical protein n=1 Tax=Streptomyces sp. NPDC017966 TaxID=3365023 RepID=UPI0037A4CA66